MFFTSPPQRRSYKNLKFAFSFFFLILLAGITPEAFTQPHLCSGTATASYSNPNQDFVMDSCRVVQITASGSCLDQCSTCTCGWGITDGNGQSKGNGSWTCGNSYNSPPICLPAGSYTLSVDVCDGVSVTVACLTSIPPACCP